MNAADQSELELTAAELIAEHTGNVDHLDDIHARSEQLRHQINTHRAQRTAEAPTRS